MEYTVECINGKLTVISGELAPYTEADKEASLAEERGLYGERNMDLRK